MMTEIYNGIPDNQITNKISLFAHQCIRDYSTGKKQWVIHTESSALTNFSFVTNALSALDDDSTLYKGF